MEINRVKLNILSNRSEMSFLFPYIFFLTRQKSLFYILSKQTKSIDGWIRADGTENDVSFIFVSCVGEMKFHSLCLQTARMHFQRAGKAMRQYVTDKRTCVTYHFGHPNSRICFIGSNPLFLSRWNLMKLTKIA